jgi:hypothetical protein
MALNDGSRGPWLLTSLVNAVETMDGPLEVTIFVGGTVVTGSLIPAKRFAEGVVTYLKGSSHPFAQIVGGIMAVSTAAIVEPFEAPERSPEDPHRQYHLSDARVIQGGAVAARDLWVNGEIGMVQAVAVGDVFVRAS